jgi:MoaA/NifB/PqqE/SkfB family radical SAM enzyme
MRLDWLKSATNLDPETAPLEVALDSIVDLDLRFGTKCNLKCRMCSPYSSSAWMNEWDELGNLVDPIPEGNRNRLASAWFDDERTISEMSRLAAYARRVRLTGGEPVLVSANRAFMRECIRRGSAREIDLSVTTNGTIWSEEFTGLLKEFKKVGLRVSIDGLKEVSEYIRYPAKWEKTVENLLL